MTRAWRGARQWPRAADRHGTSTASVLRGPRARREQRSSTDPAVREHLARPSASRAAPAAAAVSRGLLESAERPQARIEPCRGLRSGSSSRRHLGLRPRRTRSGHAPRIGSSGERIAGKLAEVADVTATRENGPLDTAHAIVRNGRPLAESPTRTRHGVRPGGEPRRIGRSPAHGNRGGSTLRRSTRRAGTRPDRLRRRAEHAGLRRRAVVLAAVIHYTSRCCGRASDRRADAEPAGRSRVEPAVLATKPRAASGAGAGSSASCGGLVVGQPAPDDPQLVHLVRRHRRPRTAPPRRPARPAVRSTSSEWPGQRPPVRQPPAHDPEGVEARLDWVAGQQQPWRGVGGPQDPLEALEHPRQPPAAPHAARRRARSAGRRTPRRSGGRSRSSSRPPGSGPSKRPSATSSWRR